MNDLLGVFNGTISALKATPAWLGNAAHVLIGSRFYVAVSGMFFLSFMAHLFSAPTRFPPFVDINPLAFAGLGADLGPDLGAAPALPGEVETRAQSAAETGLGYAGNWLHAYFAEDSQRIVHANQAGLVISGIALLLGLWLMTRQEAKKV